MKVLQNNAQLLINWEKIEMLEVTKRSKSAELATRKKNWDVSIFNVVKTVNVVSQPNLLDKYAVKVVRKGVRKTETKLLLSLNC